MDSGSSCERLRTAVCESVEAINIAGPFVSFLLHYAQQFTHAQQHCGNCIGSTRSLLPRPD